MPFLLALQLLLSTLASSRCAAEDETPAMKLVLTDKALRYAVQIGPDALCEKMRAADIPSQRGSFSLGWLGDVDYALDGMRVVRCELPEPSVQFDEENAGLKASVDDLVVAVRGDWSTHYGIIHDGGTFSAALTEVTASTGVAFGSDADGRPTLAPTFCYGGIGDVDVEMEGGGSWLIQPFLSWFRDDIKSQIEKHICPGFLEAVGEAQSRLAAMTTSLSVPVGPPDVVLGVPLTSAPRVQSSRLGLDLKGEFHYARHPTEPPFGAEPFAIAPSSDYMAEFGFSEFAVNSASYVYASTTQVRINDSVVPPLSPVRLNTTSFGTFAPRLPEMFPDMLMELHVDAADVPMFRFASDGAVGLNASVTVKAFAIRPPDGTLVPLFKLGVNASFLLKVFFSQEKVKGAVDMRNFAMALLSSEVGDVQVAKLQGVVNMGLKVVVLPKTNAALSRGVDIPSFHGVRLVNPVVLVQEGFVVIASDVKI